MAYGGASAKVLASIEYYLEDHAPKMLDLFRAFGITARLSHNYGVGVLVPSDGGVSLTAEHEKATTNKEGCALKVKLLDLVLPASVTPAVLDELAAGGKIVTAAAREHKITGKNGAWTIGGAAVTPASVTIIHCGRNGESSDPVSFVYNINKPSLPDGTPTDKTLKGILSPPMGADKKRKGALEIEGGGGDGAIMSEILTHVVGDKSAAVKKLQLLLYAGLSAISPPDQQTPPALGQIALLVVPETDDAVDLFTALVGLAHFDRWGASGVVKEEVFAFRKYPTNTNAKFIIMSKPFIDFGAVKAAVSFQQVLEHYGFTAEMRSTRNGDGLRSLPHPPRHRKGHLQGDPFQELLVLSQLSLQMRRQPSRLRCQDGKLQCA